MWKRKWKKIVNQKSCKTQMQNKTLENKSYETNVYHALGTSTWYRLYEC